MWILSLLLVLPLPNMLMADIGEDLENCVRVSGLTNLTVINSLNLANARLEAVCPITIDLLNCVGSVVEDNIGYKMDHLAQMLPGTDIGKGAQIFVNSKTVLRDLCTPGSDLNTKYKENEACFNDISRSNNTFLFHLIYARFCAEKAGQAYEAYVELERERRIYGEFNKECMVEAYKSACFASYFHKKCGQSGFDFYQDMIKRTGIFRVLLCSPEALNDLKTKFVQSLDVSESQRTLFRAAFDLRKRRK